MLKKFRPKERFFRLFKKERGPSFRPFVFTLKHKRLQAMRAKEGDLANLLFLEKQIYDGESPWTAENFRAELSRKDSLYIVVYYGSSILAVIGMRLNNSEAHITNLSVTPQWQGQGLGTYLMRLMIDYARQFGCQMVSLEVRANNEIAKKLYQSLGFKVNLVRPNYYQDDHQDGLNMVLNLKP